MGAADWRTGESLASRLRRRPASFDFFQWIRLSSWPSRDAASSAASDRGARQVDARLRFRADMSSAFPGSEISAGRQRRVVRSKIDERRLELFVTNYVLSGVLGPLPDSFADWIRQRLAERDPVMAEFLDIFNHRISTLRYELKAASVAAFDACRPESTHYADIVGALMGLAAFEGEGADILKQRVPIPKRALLALCGLVCNGRKSAAELGVVMGIYFQAPVQVEELFGAWRDIEVRDQTRLGHRRIADTAPLGKRVWDNQAAVGLTVGPVLYKQLCMLLHDCVQHEGDDRDKAFGIGYAGAAAMVHFLLDRHVDVVVTVLVEASSIPPSLLWRPQRIAGFGSNHGLRLGQTAWLNGKPGKPRPVRFTIARDAMPEAA
ncbi:MAG TPA: type VI secretion system baseplate subunit TssG [Dyella sp.]|nr:type VI secretion system baseplate subunit TssG [Dyella sp.]